MLQVKNKIGNSSKLFKKVIEQGSAKPVLNFSSIEVIDLKKLISNLKL